MQNLSIPKSAHFIGLCGKAMSAVAKILKDHGWEVTGSDFGVYPPISDVLKRYQIPCIEGHRAENIPAGVEWIVIGKHAKLVPETNEEVAAAFASGARILSFPEVLAELSKTIPHHLVVVGSYGKSTCTALATWVLQSAGKQPGWLIGADAPNFEEAGYLGAGELMVFEGDEYPSANWDERAKFLHYGASSVLLTSGEHDHINVFPTLESYHQPFLQLLKSLPAGKRVVYSANAPHTQALIDEAPQVDAIGYGLEPSEHTAWWPENLAPTGDGYQCDIVCRDEVRVSGIQIPMLGQHNVENVVGVAAWLLEEGLVTPEELKAGVASFLGVVGRLRRNNPGSEMPL